MANLRLTVATGDYEITRALKDGTVTADGLDLTMLTRMGSQEFVSRMIRSREFDVAETGVNFLVSAVQDGFPKDMIGIPVFPHRRFRHGFVFVNPENGIKEPKELVGQRVGSMFVPTANIWVRGILEEYHGLPYKDVKWVGERVGLHQMTPSWHEMPEAGVKLQDLLLEGKIAGLICPDIPPALVRKDPRIRHMFPDYKSEEVAYFKKTGIYPIMHTLIIKREIVDRYPWVATNLVKAFEESKRVAYRRMINPRIVPLAFYRSAWEEQDELMGPDPWEYGLSESNRKNLETFLRYMSQQEMFDGKIDLDDLFAPVDLIDVTPEDWN